MKITQVGDSFHLLLSPETTPTAFEHRVIDLMRGGFSETEARQTVASTPICMELFCDPNTGLFAVESEPLLHIEIINPYTGEEIPNENVE